MTAEPTAGGSPTPASGVKTGGAKLMRQLRRTGVGPDKVDIWQDDRAAAKVREASGGDERVAAVQIGGDVAMGGAWAGPRDEFVIGLT